MPFDRSLWSETFQERELPLLPCPRCKHGRLTLAESDLVKVRPAYNLGIENCEDFEADWKEERFTAFLRCNIQQCGEAVAVSGEMQIEEYADEFTPPHLREVLRPHSMCPTPPIIRVPENIPPAVKRELLLAFELFWADLGASAIKIRVSLERLMDHFKVARSFLWYDKKNPGAASERRPLALSGRIDKFAKATKDNVHSQTLHALRRLCNLGAHSTVAREGLLDAFQIYEAALEELIEKKSKEFAKLVAKVKAAK